MVDLHDLRERAAKSGQLHLSPEEAAEVLTELEAARKILSLDERSLTSFSVQESLATDLMICLSKGLVTREQARPVAALITQEIAGLTRMRVRTERRCLC